MEGVGARLGRSSSRYGTTTVFSGPVRKWKKQWVPISNPSSSSSSSSSSTSTTTTTLPNGSSTTTNGNGNGNGSHLRLFKWTPLTSNNNNKENHNSINGNLNSNDDSPSNGDNDNKDGVDDVSEEPPRRKFKYIPIAVLEEHKRESEENSDDEAKATDADENEAEQASKSDGHGEKPDINDVPMEENPDTEENPTAPGRQDLNETLDLSLGLTSHEEDHDPDSKSDPTKSSE